VTDNRVVVVMLRQPYLSNPGEKRSDPFWEFGSFGTTGCHRTNLMNPKKLSEHEGARFAFAQNGPSGIKLVHLTPPVMTRQHRGCGEVNWEPKAMPISYRDAPVLIDNSGYSDFQKITTVFKDVNRSSPIAKFSSKFRTRRQPLKSDIGDEIVDVYDNFRNRGILIANTYIDALPYDPPKIDRDRLKTYEELIRR
jgi:hypothetical protein